MPWKLILFILSVILVTIFIGFNLGNACDVSLGVYVFKDVPIFMSLLLDIPKKKKSLLKKNNLLFLLHLVKLQVILMEVNLK